MSLDVYMHGEKLAALLPGGGGECSLAFEPAAVERLGAGSTPLSVALPLRAEPYSPEATRAYVEGLLPQGRRREQIAAELGLEAGDGYGLIAELGRDCPGAVTFLPEGAEAPGPRRADDLAWLDEEELEEVVQSPPARLFDGGREQRMRFALPGKRHKLALVRDEARGRWAWPEPGAPSTHVVKPEPDDRPGVAANEVACSTAYGEMGLPVAHSALEWIGGRTCVVSKRFDRWGAGVGAERLHQESFAQALGIAPDAAEGRLCAGAPTLGESCGLLRAVGEGASAKVLMRIAFCDLTIGNGEPRGGGAALLFAQDRPILAPFYDIVSTEIYGEVRSRAIAVGTDVPPAPFLVDLAQVIAQCGFVFQSSIIDAVEAMARACASLGAVAKRAHAAGWYRRAIDEALQLATSRTIGFREEAEHMRPPDR